MYTYNFRTWKVKSWRPSVTSNGSFSSSIRFSLLLYQVWCWGMKWFWGTLNQVSCIWDRYQRRAGTRLRHYLHLEKTAQNLCNWESKLKFMSMTDNTKTNNKHDKIYFGHLMYLSVIVISIAKICKRNVGGSKNIGRHNSKRCLFLSSKLSGAHTTNTPPVTPALR